MKKSIFLFFAAILCSMTANAYDQSAVDLYFDNSEAKWSNCFVYIGHGSWTSCYPLTRVSGTQYLWQLAKDFNSGNSWNGASGWVVCKEKWWDSNGETIDKFVYHGAKNVTEKKTSAWSASYIYKTDGTKSVTSDGKTETVYKLTSSTKSNYTVTISTVEGGTLTVKDYDNATVSNGASKIKLTVLKFSATPASGYIFDGVQINNGSTTTTISAANISSETYTLTSNVTITPIWKATTSTVTVTVNATNGTVAGAGVYEEGASVTLTATPNAGYKFVNWTVAGAEVSTANPYTFTAETDVTVTANFEELLKETIYFVNNKGWNTVNAYAWNKPADINNGWPGVAATKTEEKVAGFDVYSFTAAEGQYTHVIFNTDGSQTEDLVWTAGKYYWMGADTDFAGATKEEVESTLATPIPDVWTIVGAKGLLGTEWDVNASANNMQLQQDGSYILTRDDISLAKGDYEYKAVKDHSYNVAIPQHGNQKLTIETAGIYDVTFTLKSSTLTVDAKLVKEEVIIPTVFVAGKLLNNWSSTANELVLSKDSLTASATIALKEGTDSIKMVVGGNWLGNNGKMTRENDGQAWTFKADEGNCAIVADIAGNYVFTWNFDKNQLTVTYPELPTYNVTATVNPAETGSVEGAKEYKQGEQATLTATPAEGYEFTCWTAGKDTVSTENPYKFTVTADVAVVANFVAVDYKDITFTVGKSGFTGVPQIKWWGAKGLEDAAEPVEMTAGQYNRYSYTFSNIDAITGVSFYIVLDGVQSKTITLHETPNTYSQFYTILQEVFVTLDGEIEGVQLEGHPMAGYSSDYTKVNGVVQLPANTTKAFKLTVDGKDKGGNTIALTKDNLTANFTEDGEGNATIATELAGGYLFTYDYITKDVTVVYPFVGTMDLGQMTPSYSDESVTLKDDNYNEVTIYNVVEGEHTYGENFDIEASVKHNGEWYTLTGKGSWTLADGVMTLVTTNLVDENKTVNYTITATALAPQEYTIVCNGTYDEEVTEYYSSIKYAATTDEEDVIVIEIGVYGEETSASGQFNDTWFTTLTYTVAEGEDGVKVLTATATDEAGNTYHITITATKLVYPSVNIYGATATLNEEEGALTLSGEYEGQTINCEIWGYIGAGDYEYVGILAADYSFEWGADIATVTEDGDQYTITGVFMDYTTEEKYEVMITTAKNPATALENVTSTVAPVKAIVNGQLVIVKDGVQYNAQGAVVK